MKNLLSTLILVLLLPFGFLTNAQVQSNVRFEISLPESAGKEPLDGRLLLLISTNDKQEPRFQISEDLTTQQVFGVDVDAWKPGQKKLVDQSAFGYPVRSLTQLPAGEYWVQALLHKYETFKRSDGHTVKLPMDRGLQHAEEDADRCWFENRFDSRQGHSSDRTAERHEVRQAHQDSK